MLMVLFNATKHNLLLKVAFNVLFFISLKLTLLWFILITNLHYFLYHNNWKYGGHVQFDIKITFIHSAIDKTNYIVQAQSLKTKDFFNMFTIWKSQSMACINHHAFGISNFTSFLPQINYKKLLQIHVFMFMSQNQSLFSQILLKMMNWFVA